jgi:hypothetical protein
MIMRKSSAVIGVSAMASLMLATGATFAARPIPTVFNPTIVQAMNAVAGHTTLPLNAPTLLPHRSSGYLTAMTATQPDAYQVTLWDTRHPLHVNNAAIVAERMPGGNVARFGAVRLVRPMPPQGAPNYLTALEQHNPLWAGGPATLERDTIDLGDGIQAVHYQSAAQVRLEWMEGDWTIEVAGRSLIMAEKAAVPVVHLLNADYLPPYPGIYAVRLQHGGRTAITSIDWMRGRVLSYVTNNHASVGNPTVTGGMAISWRSYVPQPRPAGTPSTTPAFAATSWRLAHGNQVVPAVAPGFTDSAQHLTFSPRQYAPVEGFSGQLQGHPFVLDFYQQSRIGLFVGVQYNHRTVYFGYGPSPVFYILNFTGNSVVLGNPAGGQYMAINLISGRQTVNPQDVVPMKGYRGLGLPNHVLGLSGQPISPRIAYPS